MMEKGLNRQKKLSFKKKSEVIITFLDEEVIETEKSEKEFYKTFGAWRKFDVDRLIKEIYKKGRGKL